MTKSKYKLLPNYTLEKITPKVNANTLVPPPHTPRVTMQYTHVMHKLRDSQQYPCH